MFGDIVGWHQRLGGGGGCYWHLMSRGRDVLQHPTVGRVAPYEQRIIPFKMLMDGEKERPARESAKEDFLLEKKKMTHKKAGSAPSQIKHLPPLSHIGKLR